MKKIRLLLQRSCGSRGGSAKHGEFLEKLGKKNNYQINLTNQTPFVNLNPLSRNPGSVPVQSDKSRLFMHLLDASS